MCWKGAFAKQLTEFVSRNNSSILPLAHIFGRTTADGIASMDLFVVPTVSFRLSYGILILQHARRELLWLEVTAHPTAEWIAQQLVFLAGAEYHVIWST